MGATFAAASNRPDFVPADMDELTRHYYDYILGMVRKARIPDQEADDSVQYILERLAVTDVIGQYDPDHLSEHQGRQTRTRFSTFLGAKVSLYCRGECAQQRKRIGRELLIMDAPAGEVSPLAELLDAAAEWDDYSDLDMQELVTAMRDRLPVVPRSSMQRCDLVSLFDALVAEIEQTGWFTIAGMQEKLGVSRTTVVEWLSRLRKELSPKTEIPVPSSEIETPAAVIGGVPLTAEQIASALDILRAAPGGLVCPPLAKAGHPLAMSSADWYHRFAREEFREFPDLSVRSGMRRMGRRGRKPGCVKNAVIHRLERILEESSAPAPESEIQAVFEPAPEPAAPVVSEPDVPEVLEPDPEPVTPEEELEAELWKFIRDAGDVDRIKAMAQRAYAVSALWKGKPSRSGRCAEPGRQSDRALAARCAKDMTPRTTISWRPSTLAVLSVGTGSSGSRRRKRGRHDCRGAGARAASRYAAARPGAGEAVRGHI